MRRRSTFLRRRRPARSRVLPRVELMEEHSAPTSLNTHAFGSNALGDNWAASSNVAEITLVNPVSDTESPAPPPSDGPTQASTTDRGDSGATTRPPAPAPNGDLVSQAP